MSVMERAHYAGATTHELLMNHRAFATLHQMPSNLFYDAKMVTGHTADTIVPSPTRFICKWMEANLTGGSQVTIPRILAHVRNANASTKVDGVSQSDLWASTRALTNCLSLFLVILEPNSSCLDDAASQETLEQPEFRQRRRSITTGNDTYHCAL